MARHQEIEEETVDNEHVGHKDLKLFATPTIRLNESYPKIQMHAAFEQIRAQSVNTFRLVITLNPLIL